MHYVNNWLKHKEGLKCLEQKVIALKLKNYCKHKQRQRRQKVMCKFHVECYNQPLIDMKEQYQKNVEMHVCHNNLTSFK